MNKISVVTIFLLLLCASLYTVGLNLIGIEKFQLVAIFSELITLIIGFVIFENISQTDTTLHIEEEKHSFGSLLSGFLFIPLQIIKEVNLREHGFQLVVATIVIGNALLGIINLQHVLSFVDFSETNREMNADLGSISFITGSLSIIISQVGGWFLQIILVYLLAVILDTDNTFSFYVKIVGLAYVGFFLSSLILLGFNLFSFTESVNFKNFYDSMSSSNIRIIIGKIGEFWTLCLIAYFIIIQDGVKPKNALAISFLPNILLMSSFLLFEYLL